MRQSVITLFVCLLVVAGSASVTASVGSVDGDVRGAVPNGTTNDTASDAIAPGERLAGVVGVRGADLKGDLESRTFGRRVESAATPDAKAEIVSAQFEESRARAERLADRLTRLQQARRNGTISEGRYAARVAETRAELNAVAAVTSRTANVSEGLPAEALRANGVNATAIRTLQRRAGELSGPEVARVARTITGPDHGQGPMNATDRRTRPARSADTETVTPGPDRTTTPASNRTVPIRDRTDTVANNQTGGMARNRTTTATGDRTATVARNRTATVDGNQTATAARNRTDTASDRTTGTSRPEPSRRPTADGGHRQTADASTARSPAS
ncbi:hypothetical protein J2754_000217 [Halarchaeum solikamskense]|uniref:bacteriophage T4 gp5 trimerisation domain-containing protein n=1 Tax=Halarchaeum nitratireducens TaxID=489913 RepID=UPI001B3A8081|nr:hypothetical protein [Halarchaeum solikamskense]MBP2249920.1 hypothetical protein [Halarchaeum solikamskense]